MNFIKVVVGSRGYNRVDPQTTLTNVLTKFIVNNRIDALEMTSQIDNKLSNYYFVHCITFSSYQLSASKTHTMAGDLSKL